MATTTTPITAERISNPTTENKKGIDNHKEAAKQHEAAAKHHLDAAKHHEAGDHGKAAQSTIKADGHSCHAAVASKQDVKHHVTNG